MGKGIIVASFGTSYKETRRLCIESIENRIRREFSGYQVERGFTSQMVINKLKKRDGIVVNNVTEALQEMEREGITKVFIQSLHIIPGHEYNKLLKQVELFKEKHKHITVHVGAPLLYDSSDYENVVKAIEIKDLKQNEAVVFMGHGTDHMSDRSYSLLEKYFRKEYSEDIFIGTVEGSTTLEHIIPQLIEKKVTKVKLIPFMLVAGDHAINDMAGEQEDSWKSILKKNGFQVEVSLSGLGEDEKIQDIFVLHLKDVINN
ncbi:sirohydrochlorin cobaltochelatase [Proteiniborus ethanoligenes]|uniref:Sirohydrochlorin cobaltochelatase n=1 Tax=Proteiniborus ethanoligenes TaxID=415015 RepID=A0A1H3QKM9_9FIRM|nr:sirohydrochlorin cobaltochelatase [Proteiniborus ethanoligenes]SDZ13661.1 sirohydrochlorin cobaltochelatase [Proteiniborus ethanoligenes]